MYNKTVLDHFQNPRNLMEPKNYDAMGTAVNPVCGDVMTIYLQLRGKMIEAAYFKTMGCGAAIASGSMITELAKGKPLVEADGINPERLLKELGGLPAIKMHCPELAVEALHKALTDSRKKQSK